MNKEAIMKKTPLAIVLLTMTTTASANELYDNGTTSLTLNGEIDTYLSSAKRNTIKYDLDADL